MEFFANNPNDPPDFTIGEEVNLVGSGPIRVMYNPSLVGDPNCFSASIPTTETHAAAGPFDAWFTLVAKGSAAAGGQPASPTCNGATVTGIGRPDRGDDLRQRHAVEDGGHDLPALPHRDAQRGQEPPH